jgi:hypothetical protein
MFLRACHGDLHAKVGDDSVQRWVLNTEEGVLWSVKSPYIHARLVGTRQRCALEIVVDNVIVVQVIDTGQDRSANGVRPALPLTTEPCAVASPPSPRVLHCLHNHTLISFHLKIRVILPSDVCLYLPLHSMFSGHHL